MSAIAFTDSTCAAGGRSTFGLVEAPSDGALGCFTPLFSGSMTFVGGTGRFANASGSATFEGTANLATNTLAFSFEGTVAY